MSRTTLSIMTAGALGLLGALLAAFVAIRIYLFVLKRRHRSKYVPTSAAHGSSSGRRDTTIVAFFHPHCNGGGGGERVLWVAIAAVLSSKLLDHLRLVIYTGDDPKVVSPAQTLANVKDKFSIDLTSPELSERIGFVHITSHKLLDGANYPRFTMVMQALASIVVGIDCLCQLVPDVYFDTTGAAFSYPAARLLAGCTVISYTHYPMISVDMLNRVREQRPSYNNDVSITSSTSISTLKLIYYQLFAVAYGYVGRCAHLVIVNSSWTEGHIASLWGTTKVTLTTLSDGSLDSSSPKLVDRDNSAITSSGSSSASSSSRSTSSSNSGRAVSGASAGLTIVDPAASTTHSFSKRLCVRRTLLVRIYPPCNTSLLSALPITPSAAGVRGSGSGNGASSSIGNIWGRQRVILSVGQFRPEKDHMLQIRSFLRFRRMDPDVHRDVRLVIIGGCRNGDDWALLERLKAVAHSPDGLPSICSSGSGTKSSNCEDDRSRGTGRSGAAEECVNNIEFIANAPFAVMLEHMSQASIGLHTMWNEHFGISVVEMMAAGLLVIAHDSGGPQMDIVTPALVLKSGEDREAIYRSVLRGEADGSVDRAVGFLASTEEEYAQAMALAISGTPGDKISTNPGLSSCFDRMRLRARDASQRFSDELFSSHFRDVVQTFIE